jgi:hypothetical protein
MAYQLKTENYLKRPSAEMRKLWVEAWGLPISQAPETRIDFSLRVKEILAGPDKALRKAQLVEWRKRREAARKARREANREDASNA